ncbi:tetraspanin-1-like [Prorops nasuta]|uniref:tetraspanin-1-like n=1 Tax=Prorops nasuta TaxID=863751 RepID=UPI0034D02203
MHRRRYENDRDIETETETFDENFTITDDSTDSAESHYFNIGCLSCSSDCFPRKCLKCSFYVINGVIFFAGTAAFITSIWMLSDRILMSRLLAQRLFVTILMLLGSAGASLGLIGIIGLSRRKRKVLVFYVYYLSLLLIVIFVCAVISYYLFKQIVRKLYGNMITTIENYRSADWAREAWDSTHRYLRCCGLKSYDDWEQFNVSIPQSCCSISLTKCPHDVSADEAYQSGCLKQAILFLTSNIQTVALSTLLISFCLLFSLLIAHGLIRKLKAAHSTSD